MGKSVKLTDGSYIDAEGVYDATLGMTQRALNDISMVCNRDSDSNGFKAYSFAGVGDVLKINLTYLSNAYNDIMGLLFGRRGLYAFSIRQGSDGTVNSAEISKLFSVASDEPTISYSDKTCTITLPSSWYATSILFSSEHSQNIEVTTSI